MDKYADMNNGKSRSEAEKSIKSSLSSAFKEEYLSSDNSKRSQIKTKLKSTGYFDDEDFTNWEASAYNSEAMVEAFGPDKADVIYDCAGNNITMGQAIKYARKGSVIVLVAVFAGMASIDLAVANDHELDIKSTMMYRHDDYIDGITLVNDGKVHLRPLISKTFAFKDYLKAYQYIDDNRETTMKVIINVQEK